MPQPAALDVLQEPLLDSYRRAWARIMAEQRALELEPLTFRRKIRLTEMRRSIESELAALDKDAAKWIAEQLPQAYSSGMMSSPGGETTWTQIHRDAVDQLSTELYSELLAATDGVRDSTKQLVRSVGRDAALQKALEGKTADQAAKEMRRVLAEKGIFSVTYKDGSKHGLAEYSQVAMRTTTAKAYNRGTLNAHAEVTFFEVFDGPNCGLTSHDDPQLALGMVISRADCEAYPISHPNCRRAFGPRPDITRSDFAEKAEPTSTKEQRQAQLDADGTADKGNDVFVKREKRLAEQRERYRIADKNKMADRDKRLAERQKKVRVDEETQLARAAQEQAAREAAARLADPFPNFPRLDGPEDYKQAMEAVNPGRGVPERRNNCHFVAPSMEMRARGYNIVASPTFKNHGRYDNNIENDWVDPATGQPRKFTSIIAKRPPMKKGDRVLGRPLPYDAAQVEAYTSDWPPGARGFMICEWNNGGGHIFNVYKDSKGKTRYIDGQVKKADATEYLARSKTLRVMRVDDLDPVPERIDVTSKPGVQAPAGAAPAPKPLPQPGKDATPEEHQAWFRQRYRDNNVGEGATGEINISKKQQQEVGLRLLAQMQEDYGTAGRFARSLEYTMHQLENQLKKIGVVNPYSEAQAIRQATKAARGS